MGVGWQERSTTWGICRMARTAGTKTVDPGQAAGYLGTGRTFLEAAHALATLAGADESYGNAIAVLVVHATIAHVDALTIAFAGKKSTSGDHRDAARLLRAVLGNRLSAEQERAVLSVVSAKDTVSYQGKYFPLSDATALLDKATAFSAWAEQRYQERPG